MNAEQASRLRQATRSKYVILDHNTQPTPLAHADIAFGQPPVDEVLASERLRWVQLTSAGYGSYDRPDVRETFARRGAMLTKSSAVYADPCAQHVLAFMLAWARQLPAAFHEQRTTRNWLHQPLRQSSVLLTEQRVILFGFGSIGARLAQLLEPFTPHLTGVRRKPDGNETIDTVSFDDTRVLERLTTADHVINLLPESSTTLGYFGRDRFACFKRGAIFYNIGRGVTVDHNALLDALSTGQVGAALLDVTAPEPLPPEHALWQANNCFITPHTAGGHHNEGERLLDHFLTNLNRFQQTELLLDRAF